MPDGRAPVREGVELFNQQGKPVGQITSGGFGPTVGKPVAMGYVASDDCVAGNQLLANVRGKDLPLSIVSLPFVAHRYYQS